MSCGTWIHRILKVDFLLLIKSYLMTKHQFQFPDDNSQIFNQVMLGGGQTVWEGQKQSTFYQSLHRFLPSNFFSAHLKDKRSLTSWWNQICEQTENTSDDNSDVRDHLTNVSSRQAQSESNWHWSFGQLKSTKEGRWCSVTPDISKEPFWRQILNGCLLD